MKRVIVLAPDGPRGVLGDPKTILTRSDMESHYLSSPEVAFQALLKNPPSLFIIHDFPIGSAVVFLSDLQASYPGLRFPVVVIHEGKWKNGAFAFVTGEMPISAEVREFNNKIATVLRLPMRRSPRLLVKVDAAVESSSMTILATVVKISGTGMLIECNRELFPGRLYKVHLMGFQEESIPPLPARILREEPSPLVGTKNRYFSAVLEDIDTDWMENLLREVFAS